MADRNWRDCFLTDIIEAELALFLHLSAALDQAGILPRTVSAETLRRAADGKDVRPGVAFCVQAFAELLDQAAVQQTAPAWHPKVVPGVGQANAAAGEPGEGGGPRPSPNDQAGNVQAGNVQAGNVQAGNGQAANGWPPRLVGDDDPDRA